MPCCQGEGYTYCQRHYILTMAEYLNTPLDCGHMMAGHIESYGLCGFGIPFGCRLSLSDITQAKDADGAQWMRVEAAAHGGQPSSVFHFDVDSNAAYKGGQSYSFNDAVTGSPSND